MSRRSYLHAHHQPATLFLVVFSCFWIRNLRQFFVQNPQVILLPNLFYYLVMDYSLTDRHSKLLRVEGDVTRTHTLGAPAVPSRRSVRMARHLIRQREGSPPRTHAHTHTGGEKKRRVTSFSDPRRLFGALERPPCTRRHRPVPFQTAHQQRTVHRHTHLT